jgi:nucleoid DNA-binding protein
MDFINFHIAYLLTKHKRVIIPDFGAFVVYKVKNDRLNRRGVLSSPGEYSLTFNPEIIKDDGLLVHSVAKEKNIGNEEALRLVYEYADSLVNDLRRGQAVQFPWVGKIHLSDNRKIVFTPAPDLSCNASNCGFSDLSFPHLTENSEDDSAGKRSKNLRRLIVCIIIAGIGLLSVWGVLMTGTSLRDLKDLWLLNPLKNLISLPAADDALSVEQANEPIVDSSPFAGVDSTVLIAADSVQMQTQYFIIIASLTEEKEAEEMRNHFISKGMDKATVIYSDGKYRVSVETFTNKEEAVSSLNVIRKDQENSLFKDAWILEGTGPAVDSLFENTEISEDTVTAADSLH